MKILIDGDGCPVVKPTIALAKKYNIEVIVFIDTSHILKDSYAKVITVGKGADSADFKLVSKSTKGDIVVTQDYGVATMALVKNCIVINENGREYTNENIDDLLASRHAIKKALRAGHRVGNKKKRQESQNTNYINALEQIILRK